MSNEEDYQRIAKSFGLHSPDQLYHLDDDHFRERFLEDSTLYFDTDLIGKLYNSTYHDLYDNYNTQFCLCVQDRVPSPHRTGTNNSVSTFVDLSNGFVEPERIV